MYSTTKGGEDYEFIFKVLLLGNSNVGKSSLFLRFVDDIWNDTFVPTIGVDFKIKTFDIDEKKIKMQIWDTAGQERFKNITSSYYRGGNGVLVVYDITDRESFENLTSWLIEIEKNANKNVYKLLIGNKCDLEDKRKISVQEGKEFAESNGMKFIETSAKDNTKVQEAFELLTTEIIKANLNKEKGPSEKDTAKQIHLSQNTQDISGNKKSGGCC